MKRDNPIGCFIALFLVLVAYVMIAGLAVAWRWLA